MSNNERGQRRIVTPAKSVRREKEYLDTVSYAQLEKLRLEPMDGGGKMCSLALRSGRKGETPSRKLKN